MKNLILGALFVICLAGNSLQDKMKDMPPEFQAVAAKVHAACKAETGVSDASIEATENGEFPQDQALKCFLKCVWSMFGLMDDDGILDTEALKAALPPAFSAKVAPYIDECGTQIGSDPCDNAFLTNKCYFDHASEHYFVI